MTLTKYINTFNFFTYLYEPKHPDSATEQLDYSINYSRSLIYSLLCYFTPKKLNTT